MAKLTPNEPDATSAAAADLPPDPTRDRTDPAPAPVSPAPDRADDAARDLRDRVRRIVPGASRLVPPGRVAVIRLTGAIGSNARTLELIELAKRTRESKRVPAVVLDIDSPGGSATASDELFLAFERLAARKPLVASIRGTGASGAYLAAMAAHRIVANPNAIIGSIGVISAGPRLPRLLDRLGVSVAETRAGRLKGMGAPWREETDEERAKEQEIVDAIYDAFVGRVAKGRHLTPERARELATGEVWLGEKARELGLVDEIGDLERATEIAAAMAHVPAKSAPVRIPRPLVGRLLERFTVRLVSGVADELELRLGDRYRS